MSLPTPPLIELTPGMPIPGPVSLHRYTLCNDAILLAAEPPSIAMPQQPWAYGVQFPLDFALLNSIPPDRPAVVQLKLVVEGGMVGVAACNSDRSQFTTAETVAIGAADVTLTVNRAAEAGAVVIRNTGGEAKRTRVTIREIGVFEPGKERLAPRHHDLGYDLFVILSVEKTGTQTMESALKSLSPLVRVHRVHYASAEGTQQLRAFASAAAAVLGTDHEMVRSLRFQAETGDLARTDIETVRRLGGRVAFLSAVREPIGRAIAHTFQRLPMTIPVYSYLHAACGSAFVDMLTSGLIATWRRELTEKLSVSVAGLLWPRCLADANYLTDEFRNVSGFDLLLHRFEPGKGYVRAERGGDVAVAFRTSELARALPDALVPITGRRPENITDRNVAAQKEYARLYDDFLSRLRVPAELAEAIYRRHGYVNHFFGRDEIAALVRRWATGRSAPQRGRKHLSTRPLTV
jgi:hypothetical protein